MSTPRQPRARVLADGLDVAGVITAEVTSNNHYAADCFSVQLATSANPAAGLSYWADATDALIEVQFGFADGGVFGGWTSLVTGRIDSLEADAVAGVLRIEGRDLSAALIEARIREAFANQTASDIATLLANRHGLAAAVTPTTTLVGRYYSDDHTSVTLDRLSRTTTEWDLLGALAQREGFDVFVAGTTLYFQAADDATTPALTLSANGAFGAAANVLSLDLTRAMSLAGDIAVTVKSWNSQNQAAFSQTARRNRSGSKLRRYVYVRPNLTQDTALALAQQKLAALSRHEYTLTATMPGELALSPRDAVQVAGTGSSFDQLYIVDAITRRLSARHGFTQTLRARTPIDPDDVSTESDDDTTDTDAGPDLGNDDTADDGSIDTATDNTGSPF